MTPPDSQFDALDQFVQDAMKRYHVPGVAVGVWHQGREHTAGFGVTNVDHPLPVDAETLFQIGSTTKTFTATTMMRLADMGKVGLDAPVRTYLPEFRLRDESVAERATVADLFTHHAGWLGDYFDDTGSGDDALAKYVFNMAELPQLSPLGAVYSYNNASLAVAGRVIEKVTGQTYEAALTGLILEPLGLKLSFIMPTDVMTYRFAAGHIVREDVPTVARPWQLARSAHAVGALTSSVKDQLRYARFHMSDGRAEDGTQVLKGESVRQMQERITDAPLGEDMALSWFVQNAGDFRVVRHGGATNGQLSAFLFSPERDFALTILTNADRGAELHRDASNWALEHFLGLARPAPTYIAVGESELSEYAGHYTSALHDYDLAVKDGQLTMQMIPNGGFPFKHSPPGPTPPPSRLAFTETDKVVALDPPSHNVGGEFLRKPNGSLEWFRFGGRIRRRED
jgi:CubicO group peptidase (beta-lactamase class C family)